jgi:predicted RNA-binding Zn-ribbon protein involved in translation (DUF1610 family)
MVDVKFSSKNQKIINDVSSITFKCPKCGKKEISRTSFERKQGVEYTCEGCGFIGP